MTRARRIALAPSAYAPSLGGVEELTAKLAAQLVADGMDVLVSTMRWPKSLPAHEQVDGIDVHRLVFRSPNVRGWKRPLTLADRQVKLASLVAAYRRFRPDVVHIQCVSHAADFQARAAKLLGIPLVVTLQGELTMDADQVFQWNRWSQASMRRLLTEAPAVTACSRQTLREAEEWWGRPLGDRGSVIYNGVDIDEFADAEPMQHDRPYVFALGRHVHQKGFDVLIDAFSALITAAREPLDLVIAGDGPDLEALADRIRSAGLHGRAHLVGRTDRVATARWFKGAEVFVLPSRHEPFGIVNIEAMAAGVPVIATAVGGVPEFVVDGETGLLVPPGDAEALRVALGQVLEDGELRRSLVSEATKRVRDFSWPAIADQYRSVYERVARPRR